MGKKQDKKEISKDNGNNSDHEWVYHQKVLEGLFYAMLVERFESQSGVQNKTGIPQSSLSKSLGGEDSSIGLNYAFQKLTGRPGLDLYIKGNNKDEKFTSTGKEALKTFHLMYREYKNFILKVKKGPIRIGASKVFPRYLCDEILRSLISKDDPCPFDFIPITSSDYEKAIIRHNIDFFLGDGTDSIGIWGENFKTIKLSTRQVVVAHQSIVDEIKKELIKKTKKEDLLDFDHWPKGLPFIVSSEDIAGHFSSERINNWFEKHKLKPKKLVRTVDRLLYVRFARDGLAAVILPSVVSKAICDDNNLIEIGPIDEKEDCFFAAYPRGLDDSFPEIKLVIDKIKDLGGKF